MTLRFLCRIREEEILEPLIPSILACLEHRHSYVRRNAVLAINSLYRLPRGELLLQDAPELIEKVRTCFAAEFCAQQSQYAVMIACKPCVGVRHASKIQRHGTLYTVHHTAFACKPREVL